MTNIIDRYNITKGDKIWYDRLNVNNNSRLNNNTQLNNKILDLDSIQNLIYESKMTNISYCKI